MCCIFFLQEKILTAVTLEFVKKNSNTICKLHPCDICQFLLPLSQDNLNHTRACENLNIAVVPMCDVRIYFLSFINASVYEFNLIYNYFKTKIKKTTKQLYFSVKFYVQPLSAKQFLNNFSGFFSLKTNIIIVTLHIIKCYALTPFILHVTNANSRSVQILETFSTVFKQSLHNEHSRMKYTLQKCKILLTNQFIFSFTFFLIC